MPVKVRLPNDSQRAVIIGATGSGKTVAGMWHLSMRDYDIKPWLAFDFKDDENLNAIPRAVHMTCSDPLPEQPGIYIVHVMPDDPNLSPMFQRIWMHQRMGVYIDEGYMIGQHDSWYRALLTQGRSREIPIITLSQRPVWMDRFVFSEAEFFQVFRLNDVRDIRSVQAFIPYDITKRLPEYHSYYYDVKRNELVVLQPVPDVDALLSRFDLRLEKIVKVI